TTSIAALLTVFTHLSDSSTVFFMVRRRRIQVIRVPRRMKKVQQIQPQSTDIHGAAKYLGMSKSWVRDAVYSGKLSHVRLGRSVRLLFSDLDKLLIARRVERPLPPAA